MMKTTFITLCILVLTLATARSQSLSLTWPGGSIPNDSIISLYGNPHDDVIETPVDITNNSDSALDVNVRKTEIVVMPGSSNFFCWLQCNYNVYLTVFPVHIPAHFTDTSNFVCHYLPNNEPGTAIIRYSFLVEGNPMDSVCVRVRFDATTTGMNQITDVPSLLSNPYPNPASQSVSIHCSIPINTGESTSLAVFSSLGQRMLEWPLNPHQEKVSFSVDQLSPGFYSIILLQNGKPLASKKLIID